MHAIMLKFGCFVLFCFLQIINVTVANKFSQLIYIPSSFSLGQAGGLGLGGGGLKPQLCICSRIHFQLYLHLENLWKRGPLYDLDNLNPAPLT